jgi:riboflavin kinase/FMN adenylyltransferase
LKMQDLSHILMSLEKVNIRRDAKKNSMNTFWGNEEINPELFKNPVVTIGNFDGCHLGHQEIFRRVRSHASRVDGTSIVYTFNPHPASIILDDHYQKLIFSLPEKIDVIKTMDMDDLIVVPFTKDFADIPAEAFVEDVLVGKLGIKGLVVGHDFVFGKQGKGDAALLRRMGDKFDFFVDRVEEIFFEDILVSSSKIRSLIQEGNVGLARKLMYYPYRLPGEVIHGKSRGHGLLGFPTANLRPFKTLIPSEGVYAAFTYVENKKMKSAVNIGNNPTFGDTDLSIEAFIFDLDKNIYGERITIEFIEKIRGEIKFPDAESLIKQIELDCSKAKKILER